MLLAIDAGNTNTVFAVFDGAKLLGQWRMATDARRTADEYGVWLLQVMARAGIEAGSVKAAIISTVVPQALFALTIFRLTEATADALTLTRRAGRRDTAEQLTIPLADVKRAVVEPEL